MPGTGAGLIWLLGNQLSVIRVGPSGSTTTANGTLDAVRQVGGLGMTALEVNYVRGARASEGTTRAIGEAADMLGVALSAHAPYYVSLNSKEEATRLHSVEHVVETARRCMWLGAPMFAVHGGSYSGLPPDGATDGVVARLLDVGRRMDEEGVSGVRVGLETTGRASAWGTMEEIEAVCDELEFVLPVVDFSHLHARSGGGLRRRKDFREVVDWAVGLSDRLLYCHFQSIEFTAKGEVRHLPVNAWSPDFRLLAPVLLDLTCDVHLICESPLLEKDVRLLQRILAGEDVGDGDAR